MYKIQKLRAKTADNYINDYKNKQKRFEHSYSKVDSAMVCTDEQFIPAHF